MSLAKKVKANLPKNWIVVNSTSLPDRVYYFNVRTGKSSWAEPSLETETGQPEAKTFPGQKRKLSIENDRAEIPAVGASEIEDSEIGKSSKRKMLRVKRRTEPEKAAETPQMKALRKKIVEKKSKPVCNERKKIAPASNRKKDSLPSADKESRNGAPNRQARCSKYRVEGTASCLKSSSSSGKSSTNASQSSSLISCKRLDAGSTVSGSTRGSRAQACTGKDSLEKGKPGVSRSANPKKNLAKKRLDGLNKKLSVERKKIEPLVCAKLSSRDVAASLKSDGILERSVVNDVKDSERPSTPPTELLPNIYQNTESRFRSLRARLASRSSSSNVDTMGEIARAEKAAAGVPKIPRIPKKSRTIEKPDVSNAAENIVADAQTTVVNIPVENPFSDSYFEEMDWEPIEEEKVVSEIQEVRMHLSSDQNAADQKPPDYAINRLQLPSALPNADKQTIYVVVDTNVFLSNLKAVTELLEDSPKFRGYRPVVVVPWMVLQELDYIKDNKSRTKSAQLQRSAKTAVDFLFQYFTSKHPRLQGQTAADAASNRVKYQVESPDDDILQSCLQIQESGCRVILLSNDKNLCNKAMVHNVQTYRSHESIQETLSPIAKKLGRSEPAVETRLEPVIISSNENRLEVEVDEDEAEIADDIFGEAQAIVKNFLSTIVSKEMKKLYGDNWKKHTIVQPPWSATDVLKCASKHWIAVVGDVFVRQAESIIKKLSEMFSNVSKYGQNLKNVREVLEACYDLPQTVESNEYRKLSEDTCRDVKELIDTCQRKFKEIENEKFVEVIQRGSIDLNDEQRANKAFEFFEQIWTFTNNFCGLAADLSGIPHSINYKNFNPAPTPETMNQLQPDLVCRLHQLINALRTILNEEGRLTPSHPALIDLYHNLINYLPNSGELNDSKILDLIDLLCCVNVRKEVLRTGLIQLQELCYQFCRIADFRSTMTANVIN